MPTVNPAPTTSPDAYLEAVRYQPLDTRFSYIGMRPPRTPSTPTASTSAWGSASYYDGVKTAIAQVFPDSPAPRRAWREATASSRSTASRSRTWLRTACWARPSGREPEGYAVEIVFEKPDGGRFERRHGEADHHHPDGHATQVYALDDGRKVGYVFFRNFVEPSFAALDEAFAMLNATRGAASSCSTCATTAAGWSRSRSTSPA